MGVSNSTVQEHRFLQRVYRKECDEAFTAACGEHLTLFEEALAGARQLVDAGVRVAAVTAQPLRRAEAILPLEVRQILTPFLTHSDTGGRKEVGITKILSQAAISKQRAVYVGDQVKDARAAQKAGIEMVAVAWGFEPGRDTRCSRFGHSGSAPL